MKAIKYELKIIHKKEIVLAADNRKMIEESLKTMLQAEEDLDVTEDELLGIVVEEKVERDCPGACDGCPYYCPKEEECMMDDLENRCQECESFCKKCGSCTMISCGSLSGRFPETLVKKYSEKVSEDLVGAGIVAKGDKRVVVVF